MPEVWMVNQYAVTPDLPGGTRHYDLGVELAKRGFTVKIFASDTNLAVRRRTKLKSGQRYMIERRDGVEFVWIRSAEYDRNDWRRVWHMVSFALGFLRVGSRVSQASRPQVVIGSSPHPFAALSARLLAVRREARFVLEVRDLWPQALVDMGGIAETHPGIRVMRILERYLYRSADTIIALTPGSLEYLSKHGISEDRTALIPNGVHPGNFRSTLPRDVARAKYAMQEFTIVYTGAHGPANSLHTVLEAAKLLVGEPVEFVLVGDGPSKEAIIREAAETGIRNVRFLNPVAKDEIPTLLSAADVGLITLRNAKAFEYAVSPNKLFDYMGAGLPVICCIPGEMGRLISEAKAGIACPPENPEALAGAVKRLLEAPASERERMGSNGREFVMRNFNREVLAEKLAGVVAGNQR